MASPAKLLSLHLADPNPATRTGALGTLVTHGTESLKHFVMAHAPSENVDDICADTWEIVINKVTMGFYADRDQDPIGFVLGIAHNITLRYCARHQRTQHHEIPLDETVAPTTEGGMMKTESSVDVASLRQALSDPEDQAVLQALLADQTINDMALTWNCHYKTAWRRYHKFLEHSRVALGDVEISAQFITQRG